MFAHQSIVSIVHNGRGDKACGTGVRKGVGHEVNEFVIEIFPFL